MNETQEKLRAIAGLQKPGKRTVEDHRIVQKTVSAPALPEPKPEPVAAPKKRGSQRPRTPEERAAMSVAAKARWKDPAYRNRLAAHARAHMIKMRADPEFEAKRLAALRKHFADRKK